MWHDLDLDLTWFVWNVSELSYWSLLLFCYLFSVQKGQTRQYKGHATAAFSLGV